MNQHIVPLPLAQRGAALLISLVTLLVLTIIGLSASRASTMGMLMATNAQHAARALAAAEDSVAAAERRLTGMFTGAPDFDLSADDTDGLYNAGDIALDDTEWSDFAIEQEFDDDGNLTAEYVIEYLGPAPGGGGSLSVGTGVGGSSKFLYRLSGRGMAPRGGVRIVQTIYALSD